MRLNITTFAIILVFAVGFTWNASHLPWTPQRITGFMIAAIGLGFLLVARIQLGRSFSVTAKASHLVTTGLYSRVRNPIYVFSALFILGLIIWTGRPWLLLIFAVLIPLQIFRSRKESQVLEAKFGQAYIDYKAKTWI